MRRWREGLCVSAIPERESFLGAAPWCSCGGLTAIVAGLPRSAVTGGFTALGRLRERPQDRCGSSGSAAMAAG